MNDGLHEVRAAIADLDRRITRQINAILHHPEFQTLESAWRGLHYLVTSTAMGPDLKVRVLNITKNELLETLRKFSGPGWQQSPIFKLIFIREYGVLGGEPYGCLVGDYQFDGSAPNVQGLIDLAQIAAASYTVFVAGAAPQLLGLASWGQLGEVKQTGRAIAANTGPPWRLLRESDAAKYLALVMPRFLARPPFRAGVEQMQYAFQEDTTDVPTDFAVWINAAYAMAVAISRSFATYGWCTSMGAVENDTLNFLPGPPTADGRPSSTPAVECALNDRHLVELPSNGLIALVHYPQRNEARFEILPSLNQPSTYIDDELTHDQRLAARLPYVFAAARFAQSILCRERDAFIGSLRERATVERQISEWLNRFVLPDPSAASEELRARMPLMAAEVRVQEEPRGRPGYHRVHLSLRPHYRLPKPVTLRLELWLQLNSGESPVVPPP